MIYLTNERVRTLLPTWGFPQFFYYFKAHVLPELELNHIYILKNKIKFEEFQEFFDDFKANIR